MKRNETMKRKMRARTFGIVLLAFVAGTASALDQEMEVDILVARITGLLKADKTVEALPLFEQLEDMNAKMPESFDFYYIDTLDKSNKAEKALERAELYLKKYGKKGKFYGQVIEVVSRQRLAVQAIQERAKAEEEAQRVTKLHAAAKSQRAEAKKWAGAGNLNMVNSLLGSAQKVSADLEDNDILQAANDRARWNVQYGSEYMKRFKDNLDGTVTDSTTGLVWKRCQEGRTWSNRGMKCEGTPRRYGHSKFPSGGSSWRLPRLDEFTSLLSCSISITEEQIYNSFDPDAIKDPLRFKCEPRPINPLAIDEFPWDGSRIWTAGKRDGWYAIPASSSGRSIQVDYAIKAYAGSGEVSFNLGFADTDPERNNDPDPDTYTVLLVRGP